MPTISLADLFVKQFIDICYAERKILTALPKVMRGAQSPDLYAATIRTTPFTLDGLRPRGAGGADRFSSVLRVRCLMGRRCETQVPEKAKTGKIPGLYLQSIRGQAPR